MPYLIGVGLAVAVFSLLARLVGFDRDRAFYPTVMIVIASYYGLFAVMGGSMRALGLESVAMAGFLLVTILGFKLNLWWVVGALFAHGVLIFSTAALSPIPACPRGGRSSASPSTSWPRRISHGCSGVPKPPPNRANHRSRNP